jgi:hypothetical protein
LATEEKDLRIHHYGKKLEIFSLIACYKYLHKYPSSLHRKLASLFIITLQTLKRSLVMKSSTILFTLLVLVALANIQSATPMVKQSHVSIEKHSTNDLPLQRDEEQPHLLRSGRFLASKVTMTCDKYPPICRAKGSAGPDCCRKQCVNVMSDKLNCGKCGKRCKYSEMCCQGKCVNPSVDEKHCGKCNQKCKKGSSCLYGLCSYAN